MKMIDRFGWEFVLGVDPDRFARGDRSVDDLKCEAVCRFGPLNVERGPNFNLRSHKYKHNSADSTANCKCLTPTPLM